MGGRNDARGSASEMERFADSFWWRLSVYISAQEIDGVDESSVFPEIIMDAINECPA